MKKQENKYTQLYMQRRNTLNQRVAPFPIPLMIPSEVKPISSHLNLLIERIPHNKSIPKSLCKKFSDKKVSSVLIEVSD